jgi:hypothetical protein
MFHKDEIMSDKNSKQLQTDHEEEMLDDALNHSFPASDPPSLTDPSIVQSRQPVQTGNRPRLLRDRWRTRFTSPFLPIKQRKPRGTGKKNARQAARD